MKKLILLLALISCKDDDTHHVTLYAECSDCSATFIFPNGDFETINLTNRYYSKSFRMKTGTAEIFIDDNIGTAYADIEFDGQIVRSHQDTIDFNLNYGVNIGPRKLR
jgi:hypothetical protein